jgi:hypothetical protein
MAHKRHHDAAGERRVFEQGNGGVTQAMKTRSPLQKPLPRRCHF